MSLEQTLSIINKANSQIEDLKKVHEINSDSNANHLIRNLITPGEVLLGLAAEHLTLKREEITPLEEIAKKSAEYLMRYISLLNKNFSFAQVELYGNKSKGELAFPKKVLKPSESREYGYETPAFAYIGMSERELERQLVPA